MQKSTPRKSLRGPRDSAKVRRAWNRWPGRRSTLESQTSRKRQEPAEPRGHLHRGHQTRRGRTLETECRIWFRRAHLRSWERGRSNYREELCRWLVSSSCRWRSGPRQACTSECKRSWQPRAKRNCTCPRYAAPAEWERGLRCRGSGRGLRSCPGTAARRPAQIRTAARFAHVLAVFHDQFAARKDLSRDSSNAKTFEHGIVNAHVVRFRTDRVFCLRIPYDDVGVASAGECSLLRIHSVNADSCT